MSEEEDHEIGLGGSEAVDREQRPIFEDRDRAPVLGVGYQIESVAP
jgi:hypothetical protein